MTSFSTQMSESAVAEFFSESEEILQRFSSCLSKIEKEKSSDSATIDSLYRDMHTMKGSAQLFGFTQIGQIAHAIEASLEPIRRLKLLIPPRLIDSLFKCVDLIERLLKDPESKLGSLQKFEAEIQKQVSLLIDESLKSFGGDLTLMKECSVVSEGNEVFFKEISGGVAGVTVVADVSLLTPLNRKLTASEKSEENIMKHNTVSPSEAEGAETSSLPAASGKEESNAASSEANSTVRIQVSLLDKLMNLVGEMVLVRNQVLQYSQKSEDFELLNLSQRLDLVTSELQADVMKTRMQPIGSVLGKFQRIVRDLAKDLGKEVEMTVVGGETELDKTLLEAIKDPLTHIIRNSCDHGLETSEERVKSGKPSAGRITVRAFHEGGQVIIEIMDDGRGLNFKRILEKALEKKIISQEKALTLTDKEIGNLIFAPGFSTAEHVTAVSGRGVGMDVVKTNLEKVGGQVDLQSEPKRGMTIRLRIPLTLAIVPALIIKTGSESFAIPQVKLSELVRVDSDGVGPKIELLQGKPVLRLRGQLLALVNLGELLGIAQQGQQAEGTSANIVVLNGEKDTFGLIVDEIRDTADIVVKPITSFLKKLSVYSGATIMGDGKVSLILDISGIAQTAHLFQNANRKDFAAASALVKENKKAHAIETQDFLFFRLNTDETFCAPLCLVNRLEEFAQKDIEHSGLQRIVKYRDSILPLISLTEILNPIKIPQVTDKAIPDTVSVIVVQKKNRLFGLEVAEIIDISNVKNTIEDSVKESRGILGSIIVDDGIATVVDVLGIVDGVLGIEKKSSNGLEKSSKKDLNSDDLPSLSGHVLFAEDTVFFVKQVKKVLSGWGLQITHAADGQEAWKILNSAKPGEFQFVLSDIEMPNLNGFELAEKIREDSRYKNLPLIALTTRFRDADRERGVKVGFTKYLEKLRSDQLYEAITEILGRRS